MSTNGGVRLALAAAALAVALAAQAPKRFTVRMATTKGEVVIVVHRDWAPIGAERFYELVRSGYYDQAKFFRVIAGRWAQFGIAADPQVARTWRDHAIADDRPPFHSNRRGTVAFAFALPNGRTTQVFINLRDNSGTLDRQGFAPFGEVVRGMAAVDRLNAAYGEKAGGGIRAGHQDAVFAGGNRYLDQHFPGLDGIVAVRLQP